MTNTIIPSSALHLYLIPSLPLSQLTGLRCVNEHVAGVNNIGLVLAVLGEKLHEAGCYLAEL